MSSAVLYLVAGAGIVNSSHGPMSSVPRFTAARAGASQPLFSASNASTADSSVSVTKRG